MSEGTASLLTEQSKLKSRAFDDILKEVGDFSKFQYIQWTILALVSMPQVWYTYAPAFAARKVKDTQLSCDNNRNITGKGFCKTWHNNKTYCGDVQYNTDFTSIATDFDIICDEAKKYIPLTKTIFYAGKLVGAYLFGWISDRYGRRVTLLSTMFIQFVASLIQSFSVDFTMYVILRVPLGICSGGLFIAAFTLMNEMVRPNRRMWGTTIVMVALGVALTMQSFLAYLVRDWKQFNLVITLPCILSFSCYWLVPESPRWLAARGRFKEADNILHKMAVMNGKQYMKGKLEQIKIREKKKTYHLWHLFSTRYLTRISVIEGWSWLVTSGVFYGLAFNSGNLSGNFYLNYAASGMAEIPAPLVAGYLLERIGRRKPLIAYYFLSGIFLLCISPIQALGKQDELSAVVMTLALLGKASISAAYYQIYIHCSELYPTVIRVAGIGFASLCARIGGMAAPYIVDSTSLVVPCIVFGIASITAGIATFFLPETLGRHLPDHIKQNNEKSDKNINGIEME